MDEQKNHSDFQPSEKKVTDADLAETAALSEFHEIYPKINPINNSPSSLIGSKVGHCTIKAIIGTGGMGTVYEAIQDKTRRRVAVKMIKHGIATDVSLRRFDFEIQLLARLRHPGIAQIYEAGTYNDSMQADGRPYFVMEFIQNAKTITEYIEEKELGIRDRLRLFIQVCSAVEHGHLKGVIHRDLKPGNILVDQKGRTKIIDFGVAKSTDSDIAVHTLWTSAGQIIGTLQYMSPEQCNADPVDVDTRSDLYSLGIILFELLSGKLPYKVSGVPLLEAVRAVQEENPTKLSSIDRCFRGDIETIVVKALEKKSARRYQSVTALKDDINCYLAGDPISARRPSYWFYCKRLFVRHTAASLAVLGICVTIIVAGYAILGFAISEASYRKIAEVEKNNALIQTDEAMLAKVVAEQAERRANDKAYYGNIHAAAAAITLRDMSTAHQRLGDAQNYISGPNQPHQLPFEWQYLKAQADYSLTTLSGHTQSVNAVAFNHDGAQLASGGADSALHIWNTNTGEMVNTFYGHEKAISAIVFNQDGTKLASAGNDTTIYIWDASSGEKLHSLQGHDSALWTVSPSSSEEVTSQTQPTKAMRLWDTVSGEEVGSLRGLDAYVFDIAFSPSGNLLASAGGDRTIRLWDTSSGKEINVLKGHKAQVSSVAFSPDGTRIVSASGDGTLRLWDTDSGEELSIFHGHAGAIRSVVFSSDGALIASVGLDQMVYIWDAITGEQLKALLGHEELISSVVFSNDDTQLISGSEDKTIRIWDVSSGKELSVLQGHEGWVSSVAISPSGLQIASGSIDSTIRLWNPASTEELNILRGHEGWVSSVTFSPDSSQLATAGFDSTIRIWDPATREELITLNGHRGWASSVAFSPDGKILASGSDDTTVRLWDTSTGEGLGVLIGHKDWVSSVTFSPDGTKLASGGGDNTVRIWDIATGEEVAILQGPMGKVYSVDFSPNGVYLASGSEDGTIYCWEIDTGKLVHRLSGHEGVVRSVAFNHDGTQLASGGYDFTIRLWDVLTGNFFEMLDGHTAEIISVDYSPDGARLISGSNDTAIRLWEVDTGACMAVLEGHDAWVNSVAFNSDGTQFASASGDSTVRLCSVLPIGLEAINLDIAHAESMKFSLLVEGWLKNTDGNSKRLLSVVQSDLKNRQPKEQAILRNLVLQKLHVWNSRKSFSD